MGDFGPPFFMRYLLHPLTVMNLMICGSLGVIQSLHTHAHHTMEHDVDSYVTAFLKTNREFLENKCYEIE